ncbi:MAG TPA: hypothetical protein VNH11_31125 [Pirellulales bacterium]|nr:hypothetical protein [Pirellulales bacterium]
MTERTIQPEDTQFNQGQPKSTNADPITGEPGAHPVGVGVGAAGGGITGAAIGAAAGPVGAAVGAVAGAIIGGMAGKDIAESYDPTAEDAYWREHFRTRPYIGPEDTYERFEPAYRYGWESRQKHAGRTFEEVEPELQQHWTTAAPDMGWDTARHASRDAWERLGATSMRPHGSAPGTPAPDMVPELRGEPHAGHPSTAQANVDRSRPAERR